MKYIVKKNTVHNIRHEKRTIKNKTDKNWERNWNNVLFRCKGYTDSFKPQEVKMTNKVLREKPNHVLCQSAKLRFLKQKHKSKK